MATLILFTTNQGMIMFKRISPLKAMEILSKRPINDPTLRGWRLLTTETYLLQGEMVCSIYCHGLWNAYCRRCKLSGIGKKEPEELYKEHKKNMLE